MTSDDLKTEVQDILPEMWREACDKGTLLRFRVSSGSMTPILNVGDVVRVSRIEPSAVRVGDIVAFQDGSNILVHRIIARKWSNNQLIFRHRGDNAVSSGVFAVDNLIGRVISVDKEGHEISLDTLWHRINNKIIGWRLRIIGHINYRYPRLIRVVFHVILGPPWCLYRRLLLRHL